jgi:hypothetical protein
VETQLAGGDFLAEVVPGSVEVEVGVLRPERLV